MAVVAVPTFLKGDINIDGHRDAGDTVSMMQALTDLSTYQNNHNLSPSDLIAIADVNNDGTITNADLQTLLEGLIINFGSGSGSLVAKQIATAGNIFDNNAEGNTVIYGSATTDGGERRGTLLHDGIAEIARKRSSRATGLIFVVESSAAVAAVSQETAAMSVIVSSAAACPFVVASHGASANVNGVIVDVSGETSSSSGFPSETTAGDCAVDCLFERYDSWETPNLPRRHGFFATWPQHRTMGF